MLQHVTQPVAPAQLEQCVAFYALLGFLETRPAAAIAGRARWLQRGPSQIHLLGQEDPRPGSGHVGVVVQEYDAAVARLRERGHEVEPRRAHWGAARAYVRDPAGNLVEIMASPPPGGRMSA